MSKENLVLDEQWNILGTYSEWGNNKSGQDNFSRSFSYGTQRRFEQGAMNVLNMQVQEELRLVTMRQEIRKKNNEILELKQRLDKWEISRGEFDKAKQELIDWLKVQQATI